VRRRRRKEKGRDEGFKGKTREFLKTLISLWGEITFLSPPTPVAPSHLSIAGQQLLPPPKPSRVSSRLAAEATEEDV
jgi:hypothetical protein